MTQMTLEQAMQVAARFQQAGQLAEAENIYRQILAHQPSHADAWNNLGNALRSLRRPDEAIAAYQQAINLRRNFPQAHSNLGVSLQDKGLLNEAVAAYRKALLLQPDHAQALGNMGAALRDLGRIDEAIDAFRRAILITPNDAIPHNNLGMALKDAGRIDQAVAEHRNAIMLNPRFAPAYASLGSALVDLGHLDEAIAAFRQAIALKPELAIAHYNLGKALIDAGQVDQAHGELIEACRLNPDQPSFASAAICCMHYRPAFNGEFIFGEHRQWNDDFAAPLRKFIQSHSNHRDPNRQLRIGYVSPDFRNHPVGRFLLPLVETHDPARFAICCYSDVVRPDAITARFQSACNLWRDTSRLNHSELAEQIRADGIDILVDLCGHTTGSRLLVFARKPAPVQVSYLGYPATTGLTEIDYHFTDNIADPSGRTEHLYSEKLWRLPTSNWCFAEHEAGPVVGPTPLLNRGYATFGSCNNFAKVTSEMLQLWGRILKLVPDSRLLLKSTSFVSSLSREGVSRSWLSQGLSLDRLVIMKPEPDHAAHLSVYNRIDIALDTFPYHGTTTTCDALWMGVPVITLAGETHASRVSVSLLASLGLTELVANTPDEYVATAVALAGDSDRLKRLRDGMRERMMQSPLMDVRRFTMDIENAYHDMWRRWCERSLDHPS